MKKTNKTLLAAVILAVAVIALSLLISCASSPDPTKGKATTIEEAHPDRLEKTVIGMDIEEFRKVWPEAVRSGISEGKETYVFIYSHILLYAPDYTIHTFFNFENNKLIGYNSERRGLM